MLPYLLELFKHAGVTVVVVEDQIFPADTSPTRLGPADTSMSRRLPADTSMSRTGVSRGSMSRKQST